MHGASFGAGCHRRNVCINERMCDRDLSRALVHMRNHVAGQRMYSRGVIRAH
ncbi:Protein of unknown function [Gryllus bimaculatus]|nr:Protein of unknown function [Gryllus bimaculatus]